MSLINHFKWQVRTTGQLASYLLSFIICQVASPNNRTADISLLPFIICQVASPNNRTAGISLLPFIICQVASPNNQTACVFPFTFIICQVVSSNQRTTCIYPSLPYVEWQVLHMNNLRILSIFSKSIIPQCVWSRDVTHHKPGGFRQIFYEAQWILANPYETLSKAEWILANRLSKAE